MSGEELYVVRCSIVGDERFGREMLLADAQRHADYLNNNQGEGFCKGKHTVEPAERQNTPSDDRIRG